MPAHIAQRFAERGVSPEKIMRYAKGDMDRARNFADTVYAFDSDNLYILTGTEKVETVKGAKVLRPVFEVSDFEVISSSRLGHLQIDRMIGSGRMYSEAEDGSVELALFSLGRAQSFDIFAKHFNRHSGHIAEEDEGPIAEEPEVFCPECGLRYPDPNRCLCPKCTSKASLSLRLFGLFKNYIPHAVLILLFQLIAVAFVTISPYISTAIVYDKVLANPEEVAAGSANTVYFGVDLFGRIGLVVLCLIGVKVLNLLFNAVRDYHKASVIPRVVHDLKVLIFGSMQRLSVGYYTSKQTGSLMTRVNADANNIYNFLIYGIPHLIYTVLSFVGVFIIMMLIDWQITLVVFISCPIIVLLYSLIPRHFSRLYHANWVYSSRLNSFLADSLYGQRVIKAFTQEEAENSRFSEYSMRLNDAATTLSVSETTIYPSISFIMQAANVLLLALGTVKVINGGLSVGLFMAMCGYLNMLFTPLGFLSNISNWWASCTDSSQRVFEIIDAETDLPDAENPVRMDTLKGDFEARDVLFEYDPGRPVVRNLSLSVESGKMLGIVGKTGAGKSTLVNLLARLYDPAEGVITVDGVNLKDIKIADLRKNIGIVSQDIYLFIGSIADNIRYSRPDATMEEVIAAAKAACAHEFIIKMPDGYETRVGAGGQGLSGGQLQRISIARAIIQNPSVLILDEATAAMDTETERNIQQSLAELQKGRTTIAIAHRLSTLRDADVLAVIDKGRVVEFGTHTELMALKGKYYRLYSLQIEALRMIATAE